jgi:dihydrofolate reductase
MGKFVVQQFVSADGFAANSQNEFDLFDRVEGDSAEFDQSNLEWLESVGAIVLGANTYRMFASYWPTPQGEEELIGPKINSLPKYVFSRSLRTAPWGDYKEATIESGDAAQAVWRLKNDVRGDLVLWGSLSLTHSLLRANVVDIMRLVVLPVAIGSGRGVFPEELGAFPLRFVASQTLDTLVAIDYAIPLTGE